MVLTCTVLAWENDAVLVSFACDADLKRGCWRASLPCEVQRSQSRDVNSVDLSINVSFD